jgi:hypothetical protein
MARKQIEAMIDELRSWLPNYDHGAKDYPTLLYRILASLPGGDELEDMGYETFNIGWGEIEQLEHVLAAIQDKRDVEDLIAGLSHEEEEEQVDEPRRNREQRLEEGSSHRFYIEHSRHGYSAVLIDRRGRSINVINGGAKDTEQDVLAAAQRHWPNARQISGPPRRSEVRRTAGRR